MSTDNQYCANCMFAQRVSDTRGYSRLICRHAKVGPVLAQRNGFWWLDEQTKKTRCPHFFVKREAPLPPDSPMRLLLGPGAKGLAKIVSDQLHTQQLHAQATDQAQQKLPL